MWHNKAPEGKSAHRRHGVGRNALQLLALMILWSLAALSAWAQRSTGTVLGLVTDPSGAAIPGATVNVTNTETGSVKTVHSSEDGHYTVTFLPVGRYQVEVTKEGFQKAQVKDLFLHVDENLRVNIGLTVGEVSQTITVEETAPLLKTDSPTVSQVIEEKRIVDMPLNGRNFQQLALLTPGVVLGTNFYGGTGYFTGFQLFSINGTHPDKTHYSFDGGDVSEQEIGGPTFTPPIDSIREFSVMSGQFSAEYGHGGGVINLVTKGGTNQFRGTLWEFHRNDVFAAKSFFATEKAPLKRNQYGAVFGGPIRTDRTFFSGSFEGTNLRTAQTFVQTLPTPRMRQGDFSELLPTVQLFDPATTRPDPSVAGGFVRNPFPGNIIPADRFDPQAEFFNDLNVYPLPNLPGLVNNFNVNGPTAIDSYNWSARIDHRLTDKDSLFGRFSWYRSETNFPGGLEPSPLGKTTLINPTKNLVLNWVHSFSPSLQLEGRFNVNRNRPISTSPIVGIEDFTAKSGIQGFEGISNTSPGYPSFSYAGYATFNGLTYTPNERTDTGFNYIGNLSWIRGRHSMKFGAEVRRFNYTFYLAGVPRGGWSFTGRYTNNPSSPLETGNSFADFLLGLPVSGDRYRTLDRFYYTFPDYHFYAQDDFKIRPNLTISYGIRYDLILATRSSVLNLASFDRNLTTPNGKRGAIVVPNQGSIDDSRQAITRDIYPIYKDLIVFADQIPDYPFWLVDNSRKDFAPRFGFSWQPFNKKPFVVRGGYGLFYELPNVNIQSVFATVPFLAREEGVPNDAPIPSRTLGHYFGAASYDPIPSIFEIPRHHLTPYEQQVSFGFQYQITPTFLLDTAYVGNLGRHQETFRSGNTPLPGPGSIQDRRPFPQYRSITVFADNFGTSNYHSLQMKLEKRLSHRLTFLTSYTLSKHTGTSFSAYSFPIDPYHPELDHGLSDFDITHNFTTSVNYQLPALSSANPIVKATLGGWEIGSIISAQTGLPFTVGQFGDPANTGQGSRPDRIKSGELSNPTIDKWFDDSAFVVVPDGSFRYGNSGVNILRGPKTFNLDFAVYKNFTFKERLRWQFRWESFNLPNHPNFGAPFNYIGFPGLTGKISSAGPPRIMQFGLKMYF